MTVKHAQCRCENPRLRYDARGYIDHRPTRDVSVYVVDWWLTLMIEDGHHPDLYSHSTPTG